MIFCRENVMAAGLFRPEEFRDNCGFGLVASIKLLSSLAIFSIT